MTATMPGPTEAQCQTAIITAARTLGYLVDHQRPARTRDGWRTAIEGDAGYPDLTIVGHGRAWFIELKRRGNRPSAAQVAWLDTMLAAGLDVRLLIVPEGQQAFIDELADRARRRP